MYREPATTTNPGFQEWTGRGGTWGENGRIIFAPQVRDGLRIVDWREAPIAQLFYRYQQGEEFEEERSDAAFNSLDELHVFAQQLDVETQTLQLANQNIERLR